MYGNHSTTRIHFCICAISSLAFQFAVLFRQEKGHQLPNPTSISGASKDHNRDRALMTLLLNKKENGARVCNQSRARERKRVPTCAAFLLERCTLPACPPGSPCPVFLCVCLSPSDCFTTPAVPRRRKWRMHARQSHLGMAASPLEQGVGSTFSQGKPLLDRPSEAKE